MFHYPLALDLKSACFFLAGGSPEVLRSNNDSHLIAHAVLRKDKVGLRQACIVFKFI